VPGALVARARPEHLVARLLLGVGTSHLVAFAISAAVGVGAIDGGRWIPWLSALVAEIAFAAGFVCLGALLAAYPDGSLDTRPRRTFVWIGAALAVAAPATAALTGPRLDLVAPVGAGSVPAPSPLPLIATRVDPFFLIPLLAIVGAAFLIVRGRRATGEQRRRLAWPMAASVLLALMILGTPAGTSVLGETVWAGLFVVVAAAIPVALLAGLLRYRLVDVELYVGRTIAYAAVFVLVLSLFAAAVAVVEHEQLLVVGIAVLAALTGTPLRHRLEALVDRWLTGGRVRGQALVRHLAESLETTDPDTLARRATETIEQGLDVSWVRFVLGGEVVASAGRPPEGRTPELVVPLLAGSEEIGSIECGPRHGGWSEPDIELVRLLARHAALAVRGADLSAALAARVEELMESRARLVRTEEEVRRRLERDLHDGVQQQLVALLARLEMLRSLLEPQSQTGEIAAVAHQQAAASLVELRELVRGIHPPLLGDRGLIAAVEARVSLLTIPVSVDVDPRLDDRRFAAEIVGAAYYVISEALTNVVKHSGADRARILIAPLDGNGLLAAVSDEGRGFSATGAGTGLQGLRDRVEALGGRLEVTSTVGVGSTVVAHLPQRTGARV
jgi:signal transduction histidine kinase